MAASSSNHMIGDELDLIAGRRPKQFDAAKTVDLAADNPVEDFLAQQRLIGIGILWRRPSVPNSADHLHLRACPSRFMGHIQG